MIAKVVLIYIIPNSDRENVELAVHLFPRFHACSRDILQ